MPTHTRKKGYTDSEYARADNYRLLVLTFDDTPRILHSVLHLWLFSADHNDTIHYITQKILHVYIQCTKAYTQLATIAIQLCCKPAYTV